jgi:hypothetical protein
MAPEVESPVGDDVEVGGKISSPKEAATPATFDSVATTPDPIAVDRLVNPPEESEVEVDATVINEETSTNDVAAALPEPDVPNKIKEAVELGGKISCQEEDTSYTTEINTQNQL